MGAEFCNARLRQFLRLRSIHKTTSQGDDFRGNGRVEGAISRIKRTARTVLAASAAPSKLWPFALQAAACSMRAVTLRQMGVSKGEVLPFGTKVMVKRRSWNHTGKRWDSEGISAMVLAPSVEVVKGYVILLPSGRLMVTSALIAGAQAPPDPPEVGGPVDARPLVRERAPADRPSVRPPFRFTAKRPRVAAIPDRSQAEVSAAQALSLIHI